jgi:predicted acetyltransferase
MIALIEATPAHRELLANLMQLYAYDWSELVPLDVDALGRFAEQPLDAYWVDAWRHPFVIESDGNIAGFALVLGKSRLSARDDVFDMAEFFVMRRFRRQRVGRAAATLLFDRFAGRWEVRQRRENAAASSFWRRVIGDYTRGDFEEVDWNDERWNGPVQRFSSLPR